VSHLSPKVLPQLFKVVEVAGVLKGSVMFNNQRQLIYEAAFLCEAIFEAALQDVHVKCADAILDIYSEKSDSFVSRHYQASQVCRAYADSKLAQWGALPTTDLLRINECVSHQDTKHLGDPVNLRIYEEHSKPVNAFLEHVYSNTHHPYIRIAFILHFTESIEAEYRIHPLTLEILCASLSHPNNIPWLPLNIAKYQLFHRVGTELHNSIDDYLLQVLHFIQQEISNMQHLIQRLDNSKEMLRSKLASDPLCKHIDYLTELFQSSLCINNEILSDTLNTGTKTTIEYMKQLEACKLVSSHKCGRKKLYINNHLLPIITEAIIHG
jgi:hypothetical protein